jgi:hypothetical protein
MKKTIFLLIISLFSVKSFCQVQNPTLFKDDYLQKSKNQQTAGFILLACGTTLAVVGAISFNHNYDYASNSAADISGFLMLGGIVTDLVSIPFFISSAKNARKAATISFNNQKILFPLHNTFIAKTQLSITLRIGL